VGLKQNLAGVEVVNGIINSGVVILSIYERSYLLGKWLGTVEFDGRSTEN
jgi:hypothetical protein